MNNSRLIQNRSLMTMVVTRRRRRRRMVLMTMVIPMSVANKRNPRRQLHSDWTSQHAMAIDTWSPQTPPSHCRQGPLRKKHKTAPPQCGYPYLCYCCCYCWWWQKWHRQMMWQSYLGLRLIWWLNCSLHESFCHAYCLRSKEKSAQKRSILFDG